MRQGWDPEVQMSARCCRRRQIYRLLRCEAREAMRRDRDHVASLQKPTYLRSSTGYMRIKDGVSRDYVFGLEGEDK